MRRRQSGFTLIEIMMVVAIASILALVILNSQRGHITAGKMSEGIAGAGVIRSALRTYSAANHGQYPDFAAVPGDALSSLFMQPQDLEGRHFQAADYTVSSAAAAYTVRATLHEDGNCWYEIDHAGNETRNGF